MHRKLIASAALACALGISGLVVAQPGNSDSKKADPARINELKKSAAAMTAEMETALKKSFAMLEEAVESADVACQTSRNEAITAMKSLVKLSDESKRTMDEKAALKKGVDDIEAEHVKISIAHQKVMELFAQVKTACGIDMDVEAVGVDKDVQYDGVLPVISSLLATGSPPTIPDPPIHVSPIF